jgi:PBP1b-binding outer membrane lipoprotein LpoB
MKLKVKQFIVLISLAIIFTGCASTRTNISYDASQGQVAMIPKPVVGTLLPVVDEREGTRTYPKQVIKHTDYSGEVRYEINDKDVEDVFRDSLEAELGRLGVKMVRTHMKTPLDKASAAEVRRELMEQYPSVQVAFGAKVLDFMANSQKTLIGNDVHVSGWLQFYVLDVKTGDVLWSDYKTDWTDKVASADRNKMINQLDNALSDLMQKSVRDNLSLRDLLVKIANR